MTEPINNKETNNFDDNEISKLRDAVLNWVDKKKQVDGSKNDIKKSITDKIFNTTPTPVVKPISQKPVAKTNLKVTTPKPTLTPLTSKPIPKIKPPKRKYHVGKILRKTIFGLIGLMLIGAIIFGVGLYYFKWQSNTTKAVTKFIPYPIALVNWQPLFYYTWQDQVDTLSKFYENEVAKDPTLITPTFSEIQSHIIERMIDLSLMNQLAADYNVTVSQDEIKNYIDSLIKEIGSQSALEAQLKEIYNWDLSDFKHEIIEPLLLKNKLALAVILDDRVNKDARMKIQEILDEYNNGKKTFESLAEQYSEDITALQGGDLGYFSRGQMIKEFEDAAFNLKPGEVSDIVRTQFGYHLIKVEEQLFDEAGELTQVRAKHILIRGVDFDKFLEDYKNQAKVWRFVKI